MTTQTVKTSHGDVNVTNYPTNVRYYRGHYFRTALSVATTASGFRMIWRDTFYGHPTALRWFYTEDGSGRAMHTYTYDSSHVTETAPF